MEIKFTQSTHDWTALLISVFKFINAGFEMFDFHIFDLKWKTAQTSTTKKVHPVSFLKFYTQSIRSLSDEWFTSVSEKKKWCFILEKSLNNKIL